ncbi:hypothetical protein AGMMS49975_16450 [Clostridia bacterium]|nr:hypothetical protein AGMMS49975_16410 [Clostridia bacterium]GHU55109.1 hypothetical protein AGMMS49975_16450 [Clostridia bacterium]
MRECGTDTTPAAKVIVDIVAIDVDITVRIDIGGIITIDARRPKPPPRYNRIP